MVLESVFLFPLGLLALLSLVPLIIIYLIKHKPKKQPFPSVHFLMKTHMEKQLTSMISRFIRDPLFLLQLFALILLSATIANPYINVPERTVVEDSVIILDASASMQTFYDGSTRFQKALEIAQQELGESNTIIVVGEFPEILVEHANRRESERLLSTVHVKSTKTNLYDAIILSDDFLADRNGKVVIISDFLHTSSEKDINTALDVLRSKGITVETRPVISSAKNVGIVDMKVSDENVEFRVKNYYTEVANLEISSGSTSEKFALNPGDSDVFTFPTPRESTEISINVNDDLSVDNKVYLSVPKKGSINILYVTNSKDKFLFTALTLIDGVKIDIAEPPVVENYDYDVFVIKNVDREKFLPRIANQIADRISVGASAIVVPQDNVDYGHLMNTPGKMQLAQRIPVLKKESTLTENVDFGSTNMFYYSPDFSPLGIVSVNGTEYTVMGINKQGLGNVLLYGLPDSSSSFQLELLYPVFWKRLIGTFVERKDIKTLNYQTGKILDLGEEQEIIDPTGEKIRAKSIVLDKSGFYQVGNDRMAVNLLSDQESDVNGDFMGNSGQGEKLRSSLERIVPKSLVLYGILFSLIVIMLEFVYVKYRGDI